MNQKKMKRKENAKIQIVLLQCHSEGRMMELKLESNNTFQWFKQSLTRYQPGKSKRNREHSRSRISSFQQLDI